METRMEEVGGGVVLCSSREHAFGTDSFLLSHFAAPKQGSLACDLGCGCGVIPLLWYRGGPAPREAWAVEIQPRAVELARESVERSGLQGRVRPLLADLRRLKGKLPLGAFDLVTCNPPYNAAGAGVPSGGESERIARHETLCTLEEVCGAAAALLTFGGRFCLCQLPERLVDVLAALRAHGVEPKRLRMVQQTAHVPPWLVLVEGKRGSKPHLRIEPPLLLQEGDGPSPEAAQIYRYGDR